ncbi:MAG: amidohydrolase family protein [Clostridiales bacterium]|nr:amidohydrolase family protein [Clostridiales bacterium]
MIDFHTHIFPEKIAARTIALLSERSGLTPFTDGTLGGLTRSMAAAGVAYSVTLPIATKPGQERSVNTYAAEITGKNGIISFGSVHPFSEDWAAALDEAAALGLKGIKLHPDYQGFFIDDERVFPVIDRAKQLGLTVVFHSGVDIGLPGAVHCPPDRARRMIDAVGGGNLVFAHTGGYECWDAVETYLAGQDVYFDISCTMGKLADEDFLRVIRKHGAEKCLFGTDSPWGGQTADLQRIASVGLSAEELSAVLYRNAAPLLGIAVSA